MSITFYKIYHIYCKVKKKSFKIGARKKCCNLRQKLRIMPLIFVQYDYVS